MRSMSAGWCRAVLVVTLASGCAAPEPTPGTAKVADASSTDTGAGAGPVAFAPAHATSLDPAATSAPAARPMAAPRPVEPRPPTPEERARYAWLTDGLKVRPLEDTFAPPQGFSRVDVAAGSFGAFLRELPLRPPGNPVRAYDGDVLHEADDPRIAAVAELDVSPLDIQQCADSVIRLHAEWKWSRGEQASVGYHFLSGDYATWPAYASGQRPIPKGKGIEFAQTGKTGSDHAAYRKYLDMVFNYASTISLERKSSSPIDRADLAPGDFFVLPGGPGHAILILDVAVSAKGERVALLGQGFMPAQDFQVLVPPGAKGPWFSLDGEAVDTPFWPAPFPWSSLRRMK